MIVAHFLVELSKLSTILECLNTAIAQVTRVPTLPDHCSCMSFNEKPGPHIGHQYESLTKCGHHKIKEVCGLVSLLKLRLETSDGSIELLNGKDKVPFARAGGKVFCHHSDLHMSVKCHCAHRIKDLVRNTFVHYDVLTVGNYFAPAIAIVKAST